MIARVENAIKSRLLDDLTAAGINALVVDRKRPNGSVVSVPVAIESFPDNPTEADLKRFGASGAVLVRYVGSRYGKRKSGRQDREMHYELVAVSESLAPKNGHLGCYVILENARSRMQNWIPDGCLDAGYLVEDGYKEQIANVWQYGVTVAFPARVGSLVMDADQDSDHVREQILRKVLVLLTGLSTTGDSVRRGSVPELIPSAMPELLISLGDESPDADSSTLGETMRVSMLSVRIFTIGDHTAIAGTVMAEVEAALFGDINDGEVFDGLARSLLIGPVTSEFISGSIEYTETVVTYEVAYKTEDGNATEAV